MRALENTVAIVLVVVFFVLVSAGMRMRDCGNNLELCAAESVDEMLSDIRADGVLTVERYSVITSLLYSCGYQGGIEITEYYYEDGIDGRSYQYSVTFDEICLVLMEKGIYRFKEGSYIYICVPGYSPENLLARILYSRKTIGKSIRVG